jgi:hypothetical protein
MNNLFSGKGAGRAWGCGIWLAASLAARAATTIVAPNQYAYGANVGWLDARANAANGAAIGQYYCTGHVWSANCGWIGLGNKPTNGWRYSNASATDWGVNHDGAGNLSGYAWGANVGWIVFEQTTGFPRIDLRTGNFSGYAWGANVGWISLSNAQAYVCTGALLPGSDSDGDGMPDAWEYRWAGNLTTLSGGSHDQDGDGVPDVAEYPADTDPTDDADLLAIVSLEKGSATDRISWTTRPTRLYRMEVTNALPSGASGGWLDLLGMNVGPMGISPAFLQLPASPATIRFYRVQAVVPLSP